MVTDSNDDPAKRIPSTLQTGTKLLGSYTLGDLGVALLPAVLVVLGMQLLVPQSATVAGFAIRAFAFPMAGVAIIGGAAVVAMAPTHTDSATWITALLSHLRRPVEQPLASSGELARVRTAHRESAAIERTDGSLIGVVEVEPATMALADDDRWATVTSDFANFLTTSVDFPIQLYSTTEPFPVEAHLDRYRTRLSDPDVASNPAFGSLITAYIDWYETDLRRRQMTLRSHYVIITVAPESVQFVEDGPLARVSSIPIFGPVVAGLIGPSRRVERAAMATTLASRRDRVEQGLRQLEGCGARQCGFEETVELLSSYWSGDHPPRQAKDGLHTPVIVTASSGGDA